MQSDGRRASLEWSFTTFKGHPVGKGEEKKNVFTKCWFSKKKNVGCSNNCCFWELPGLDGTMVSAGQWAGSPLAAPSVTDGDQDPKMRHYAPGEQELPQIWQSPSSAGQSKYCRSEEKGRAEALKSTNVPVAPLVKRTNTWGGGGAVTAQDCQLWCIKRIPGSDLENLYGDKGVARNKENSGLRKGTKTWKKSSKKSNKKKQEDEKLGGNVIWFQDMNYVQT